MSATQYSRKVSNAEFDLFRGKRPLLSHLDIELTERCNNRCIHCLVNLAEDDHEAESREMETAFVLDLLEQSAKLGCLTVRFTGGEPLLRPDFLQIYTTARSLGIQVILFTNARLITPKLASLLARIPPGRMVEVTVYGMHSGSYDAVVGVKGAYEEFIRGVELLRDHHIPFVVKQALLPQNRKEMHEFEAWAATLPEMEGRPSYILNYDLRVRRDDPEKNLRIAKLRLTPEDTVAVLARDPEYVPGMREFCNKFMRPQGDQLFACGAGHGVSVDSYGNAQMCLSLRHPDMVYNLRTGSLRQALTEIFPRLREQRAINPEYLRRCAVCFLKGLCEQCPAKSWTEYGTLDTPVQYLCDVAHAQARYLGLIGESEVGWEIYNWRERLVKLSANP